MTTACPYCGATLNLNYCVVCGRQSDPSLNKMGSLKTVARNTHVTHRLEDPLQIKEYRGQQKHLRFRSRLRSLLTLLFGGLVSAILIWYVAVQAINVFQMQNLLAPWMKSHRIIFSNNLPLDLSSIKQSIEHAAQLQTVKHKAHANKHKHQLD